MQPQKYINSCPWVYDRIDQFALRRTLGKGRAGRALLSKEELETVLCGIEIESAINERPLTLVSDDPNDRRPLRPVDFLQCPVGNESDESEENLRGRRRYHNAMQARSQAGALGAIAPSAGSIAPSGASLCTLCT